ncbi:MAG: helix-turn-helix domain-containing protein [Candidatus Thorarchaeota archaeon]|jgi:DNA-binding transcriptional regulator LsrR (DeoR family)
MREIEDLEIFDDDLEDFDDIISIIGKRRWTPKECDIVVQRLVADLESNPTEKMNERIHELYYEKGLTQKEVADVLGLSRRELQAVFKKMEWTGRHVERSIDSNEVWRFYDDERLTQQEIAAKLGVSRSYIYKILRESRKSNYTRRLRRKEFDVETAHHLYCEEGLSQAAVAEKLGISQSMFSDRVREHGWKRKGYENISIDIAELHQLYYEEGLSQREVADQLGFSVKRIQTKFKELGWRAGPRGAVLDIDEIRRLRFNNDLEAVEIARRVGVSSNRIEKLLNDLGWHDGTDVMGPEPSGEKHGSNSYRLEGRILRETIFGTECNICSASREERMLAVHRKDGAPHDTEDLWNPEILQDLNQDEWSLLCPHCHHAIHWAMEFLALQWDAVEKLVNQEVESEIHQIDFSISVSNHKRGKHLKITKDEIRQLRFDIFGDECGICGRHADDSKLIMHRKDGGKHHRKSTWTTKFVRTADPNDWAMLCIRCHNGTHWLMKRLGMSWETIASHLKFKTQGKNSSQE